MRELQAQLNQIDEQYQAALDLLSYRSQAWSYNGVDYEELDFQDPELCELWVLSFPTEYQESARRLFQSLPWLGKVDRTEERIKKSVENRRRKEHTLILWREANILWAIEQIEAHKVSKDLRIQRFIEEVQACIS